MSLKDLFAKTSGGSATADQSLLNNENGTSKTNGSKVVSGRRRFGDNGFEEGGGYMNVKKSKLNEQFNLSKRHDQSVDMLEIFKDISIHINGFVDPPEPELRELFVLHGGTYHPYPNAKTTYIIATNLSAPTKTRCGSKAITPNWIMDSIAACKLLDSRKYKLYDMNQEKNQMSLTQMMKPSKATKEEKPPVNGDVKPGPINTTKPTLNGKKFPVVLVPYRSVADDKVETVSDSDSDEFFECSQSPGKTAVKIEPDCKSPPKENGQKTEGSSVVDAMEESEDIFETSITEPEEISATTIKTPEKNSQPAADTSKISPSANRIKVATDEGFLEDFFGRSRLHLISEQKKEMQMLIANLRKNIDTHVFTNLEVFQAELKNFDDADEFQSSQTSGVTLMHVDMDCFFVSVGLLKRPHLRGKPVVVTHSTGKGQDSKSDIACASYEARKFGIRNGYWVGDAKKLCPDLEVIPYDFEEYRRVSKIFFETVASVTLDVEGSSVDEMIIDATPTLRKVPGATPQSLAVFLRRIIREATGCPASIGIGSNRLLARLAVKLAKPDGLHHLKDEDAPDYIKSLSVRDLPGVGWSNEGKLKDLNVETCADLLQIPMNSLKSMFGDKTAEKMLNLCKGIDTAEIKAGLDRPKSLSVDVNFGIRFTTEDEVTQFLMKICKELSNRAEKVQATGKNFTLKLLIRRKGAGEPVKMGGHGIVDSMTRSRTLLNPSRSWNEFFKTAASLCRLMRVPATEYRGVGVTITDLSFDFDQTSKKSIQRTLTDMPISRGQRMLSISQKKRRSSVDSVISHKPDANTTEESLLGDNTEQSEPKTNGNTSWIRVPERSMAKSSATRVSVSNSTEVQPGTSTKDSSKSPVDIAVLKLLPREIAEEQCRFYGLSTTVLDDAVEGMEVDGEVASSKKDSDLADYYKNVQNIDQSFLLALPDSVRQDVLIQLQEAKGKKVGDEIAKTSADFDDQQPCSSRQAIERSKKLGQANGIREAEGASNKQTCDAPLQEQVTPVFTYTPIDPKKDPKLFWNMTYRFEAVKTKPSNRPALNDCVEVGDVRKMISCGLEIEDPLEEDVESLEKYFVQLITDGWLEQTQVLLKHISRQSKQLGSNSRWPEFLRRIIGSTQTRCKELYHGEIEVDDPYEEITI